MKYRVRLDLAFASEADALSLIALARRLVGRAVNEEIAFCEMELGRHDEGLPCEKLERVEVRA
jgi:hypothetical protein